jgi:hypothetical protein
MTRLEMKEYTCELEACIDRSLKLWKKLTYVENGEVVQYSWQFEQTLMIVNVFWLDGDEGVNLHIIHPRHRHHYEWSGLTDSTIDRVLDRVGNTAQTIMYRYPDGR